MRVWLTAAGLIAIAVSPSHGQPSRGGAKAAVVLENARVRAYRTAANALAGVEHGGGVFVRIAGDDETSRAVWRGDAAAAPGAGGELVVIVQPRAGSAPVPAAPQSGSRPGEGVFTGMSFTPLFENARVSVIRARMDVGAREGVHTHGSDTIVVHLSGGEIEDTAGGKTVVNRWKPGDVEFEARGSSHSARNIGHPVEVVLVALKP
jgi:quercetin dioxygenase-like cupin family protein